MMESPAAELPAIRFRRYGMRALGWIIVAAVVFAAVILGLHLRWWVFDTSQPIRFWDDTQRGNNWGLLASGPEGYLNQYDKMDPEIPEWQDRQWDSWLDYAPLRLLVMREWGVWQRAQASAKHETLPDNYFDAWQRPWKFNAPVQWFNTVLEGISAICAFFLTRLWVIRGSDAENRGHFLGVWQGLVAALAIWFSIDIIISAHAWFQWDSWVVPWYLCACLLASLDWWFAAGIAVAIGVNFKGQ